MSNQTDDRPFKEAFDAITPESPSPDDPGVFDGSYQCRRCGTVHQVEMFAGAARPPKQITTDCPGCGGHRPSYGAPPDGEPVLHRWYVSFEANGQHRHVTAQSRKAAQSQIKADYPDRTIEVFGWVKRVDE